MLNSVQPNNKIWKKLTLPSGLWAKANEPGVEMLYWTSSSSSLDKTGSVTIKKLLFKVGLKRGLPNAICYLYKKLKLLWHQYNTKNNGPVLLFKTIFMHWNCFLSSVAADCKDGYGLKLKKNGPTFSSFNGMAAKNYHKIIPRAVSPFLQIYWGECTRARASSGEASRREKRGRSHLLKLPSRAFGHARGHLRVSRVLLDGPRIKGDCS